MAEPTQPTPEPLPDNRATPGDERLTTASLAQARPPAEQRSFEAAQAAPQGAAVTADEGHAPLFAETEAGDLRGRWDAIQAGFVDEPRRAVEDADALVAGAMRRLAEMFSQERARLEGQWDRGDNVSTEDLRQALRRYRSFFSRLLSV